MLVMRCVADNAASNLYTCYLTQVSELLITRIELRVFAKPRLVLPIHGPLVPNTSPCSCPAMWCERFAHSVKSKRCVAKGQYTERIKNLLQAFGRLLLSF
jgi:hypothetical protein